jgi:GT2 family glycosyltransferase
MPHVAIIVLNYDTAEMTDALAAYLRGVLRYDHKDVYVIDNGSDRSPASATHRLPVNLGFTRGMYEGFRIASAEKAYDAYWFLNSDIGFEFGAHVLADLVDVLFANPRYAQISPQFNSPHLFMEEAGREARVVPYLEPTATLIRASTIETIGFWDLDLTHGWGVDYDYGYRVRQAGMASVLTNRARITHKEHKSIRDWSAYVDRASSEMHTVLGRKYGEDWERINRMESVQPVILSCGRDPELTARFAASFRAARDGMAPPIVIVDVSASPKLSARYLEVIASLDPQCVAVHPRQATGNLYESIQDAADFALATALAETGEHCSYLFVEDDIAFSSRFSQRLRMVPVGDRFGFLTFYLPGNGYGSSRIDPGHFYGTQCVLFPREAMEVLVREKAEMHARYLPGYDIRWSRYLAHKGYELRATERSYVQHLSSMSRLHEGATHTSNCFEP